MCGNFRTLQIREISRYGKERGLRALYKFLSGASVLSAAKLRCASSSANTSDPECKSVILVYKGIVEWYHHLAFCITFAYPFEECPLQCNRKRVKLSNTRLTLRAFVCSSGPCTLSLVHAAAERVCQSATTTQAGLPCCKSAS